MKEVIKKSLVIMLAFVIAVSVTPLSASAGLPNRDAYYLSVLRPKSVPRAKESYPVKLIFSPPMLYPPARLEFRGTCGVNAEITDDELLEILRASMSAVSEYRELQDPVDDRVLIQELTEKLKFSNEDMQEIIENWKKMLGVDELSDVLSFKFPGYDGADGVTAALDLTETIIGVAGDYTYTHDVSLKPNMPGGAGTIINGIFISYEQYQKDLEKYQDIITLSKTKERLRAYYSEVGERIQESIAKKGSWTIKINSQDWADLTFNWIPGNRQLWTADIDLKREYDGNLQSGMGTYTGRFELRVDTDLSVFDNTYDDDWVKWLNTVDKKTITPIQNAVLSIPPSGTWVAASNTGQKSVARYAYEIPDCSLNLSLPAGVNRGFFEISISNTKVFLTEYTQQVDRTIVVIGRDTGWTHTLTHQLIMDDNLTIASGHLDMVNSSGESWPIDNSETWNGVENLDRYMDMTLVIDMLGNK